MKNKEIREAAEKLLETRFGEMGLSELLQCLAESKKDLDGLEQIIFCDMPGLTKNILLNRVEMVWAEEIDEMISDMRKKDSEARLESELENREERAMYEK